MSKPSRFNTVPTDLIEHAEAMRAHCNALGYVVSVEPYSLGYPKVPALRCRRNHTTFIIEIFEKIDLPLLKDWVALCKSTPEDLRIAVCVPHAKANNYSMSYVDELRAIGVGVYVSKDGAIEELVQPCDLSLQVALPELRRFPKRVRAALGSAYEQFRRQQWREGFEEACKAIEGKAKAYLSKSIKSGRLTVMVRRRNQIVAMTVADANKLTLGQLAHAFANAQQQNATDALIARTLESINPDRVGVAHKIHKIKTEKSLRSNVGVHMHTIVQALSKIA